MKILIISDAWAPQVNGVVRTYEYLCDELTKRGCDVAVIGPSDFPFALPFPGYGEIKWTLFPHRLLRKKIYDFKPDHIHIAVEGALGQAARRICMKDHLSFTTSYHTQLPDYIAQRFSKLLPKSYQKVYDIIRNYICRFHAPSSVLFTATPRLDMALMQWGVSAPLKRLTRGVDLSIFNVNGPKLPAAELAAYTGPIALYVGRIAMEKNLEAFLSMDWPGSKLIVGDGPCREDLARKYPDAHFVGKKQGDELAQYYRSSDVFVFPSRTDTFGIVLIEALACGLPIAAYRVPGPLDIVTEPICGVLDDDLSNAAHRVLALNQGESAMNMAGQDNKPGYAQNITMAQQARFDYIAQNFTWQIACDQFLEGLNQEKQARLG